MKSCKCSGFTLVESMVVIAILAVLVAVAMPGMASFGHGTRLSAYSNKFLAALFFARSEAIKRNSRVAICKSSDGVTCAAAGNWSQGWIVFADRNNNVQRDAGEALLLMEPAMPDNWSISGNTPVARFVSYSGAGSTHLVSGAFQAGTISICRKTEVAAVSSRIIINSVGRPRTVRVTVPSCS